MGLLEIILILVGALLVGVIALVWVARKKPELLLPVQKLLFKSKRVREAQSDQMAASLAEDPEQFATLLEGAMGKKDAELLTKTLANRSEEERKRIMRATVEAAASGKALDPSVLQGAPGSGAKTPQEMRGRNQQKSKARAKNKKARAARKKNRRR